ncbi:MAG: glutathione S-transferase [Pseudomonadota bacterium]
MTYELIIGDRLFSSWSLRGWLMLEKFGLPHRVQLVGLYSGTFAQDLVPFAPASTVPILRTPEGIVLAESLAMAETLAEAHPEAGLWPKNAERRARARWLSAEMVSGFHALRAECPMQLAHVWRGFEPTEKVMHDLERIETLWTSAWNLAGSSKGWLLGDYSLADVFFAPFAARVLGYGLPVSDAARAYSQRVAADPAFVRWRNEALTVTYDPFPYPQQLPQEPWPKPSDH